MCTFQSRVGTARAVRPEDDGGRERGREREREIEREREREREKNPGLCR